MQQPNAGRTASRVAIEGAHVVTVTGEEIPGGHVVVEGERIAAVGPGLAPVGSYDRRVDARGCLLTPGLVNTHHHLYQWVTRGLAVDHTLFEWLTTLYPVWAGIDEHAVHTGATGALSALALSGCTTTTDHHYVFPREGGDVLGAEIRAAQQVGLRFHPTRGSMDLGRSAGGLPPDHVVSDRDEILAASADAVARWHDPSPGSMLRIALAPCSPFSVTPELMRESAALARELGVRLHTHLAETDDEEAYCRERFGATPTEYVADLGWTGPDVWFAHTVHLDDEAVKTIGATGTGVAHCPTSNGRLGAGIARVRDLVDAGARVGIGVDGAASNEGTHLLEDVKHAVLFARAAGGPRALSVREALELGTLGGARVLGREDEIGSIETGKLADLALWRLDGFRHRDVADPVAALVLGTPPPLELLLVHGRPVVEKDTVLTVDTDAVAAECAAVHRDLVSRAG